MMLNSNSIVDWLSFSLPVYAPVKGEVKETAFTEIKHHLPALTEVFIEWEWKETSGRAPYDRSYSSDRNGFRIFAGIGVSHIAIEVSGLGCKRLRDTGLTDYVLNVVSDRVSRIDLALDIETDTMPTKFIESGYSGRIRSVGTVKSDSGETVYIGSQKSDRYCRVYRYFEPHPRANFLRIEYVFRRKEAKQVAKQLTSESISEVVRKANKTYKWEDEIMVNLKSVEGLTASVAHRTKAKTLRWLITQVAPAFKLLVEEGVIENAEEFVRDHFLGKENGDES